MRLGSVDEQIEYLEMTSVAKLYYIAWHEFQIPMHEKPV